MDGKEYGWVVETDKGKVFHSFFKEKVNAKTCREELIACGYVGAEITGVFKSEVKVDDYYIECTNYECGWTGLYSECYRLGELEPLCPKCKDTTEPAQVY